MLYIITCNVIRMFNAIHIFFLQPPPPCCCPINPGCTVAFCTDSVLHVLLAFLYLRIVHACPSPILPSHAGIGIPPPSQSTRRHLETFRVDFTYIYSVHRSNLTN